MKHIKKFNQLFENNSYSKTFDQTQHEEFCQVVLDWVNETGQEIRWSLWANPQKESDEDRGARANAFNDMKARAHKKFGTISRYPDTTVDDLEPLNNDDSMERAKRFWDQYVKDGKQVTLVEMGDKLVMALIKGENIEMAFDNMDSKVDPSMIKDLI
jgi:hypothetical protein